MAGLEEIRHSRRVLFVHEFLAMGDAVLLSPVYKNIKDNVPGIKIDILTNKYSMPFVKAIPYVDRVYELKPLMGGQSRAFRFVKLCGFFLKARFDTIVLRGDERIPQRAIEVASKICGLKRILIGSHLKDEVREDRHIVETYLRILETAGFHIAERERLYITAEKSSVNEAKQFLGGNGKNLVGIAPTSKMKIKNWTPARTADLIRRLKGNSYEVLLFCADESFANEVRSLVKGEFEVIGLIDFSLLRGLLSLCRGFIGVDTGLTHLAAALEVPTVGLYGPTSGTIAGPYGQNNMAIQTSQDCPYYIPTALFAPNERQQECYSEDKCKLPITNCVEKIGVDGVMESFSKLMEEQKSLKDR